MRPVAYPTSWQRVPLISLCEVHVDCVNRTAKTVDAVTPFKMIRTTNVRNGFIDTENVRYVDESTYKRWVRRLVPKRGDVILTREAPLGEVGMVRTEETIFLGQRLYHFRADRNKLDHNFLLYALLATDLQGQVRGFGSGATVEHMRLGDIPRLEITVPSLPIQQRIGTILASYDELIENNTRRIQVLERLAQAIYREWFVNFRFPGHAKFKPFATPVGPIPQGWNAVSVPQAVEVNPRTTVPRDGLKPFIPMTSLSSGLMLISDAEMREGNSGSKFKNGDTLFARITPCLENGKTGFVQFLPSDEAVAFGSTEFIVLRSRTVTPEYVYCLARSDEFRGCAIKSMSGATGRQRVQEACFEKFQIAQPTEQVLSAFTETVRPMFKLIHCLARKNANLRGTRDLLLPRLLSGQVDVSNFTDERPVIGDKQ